MPAQNLALHFLQDDGLVHDAILIGAGISSMVCVHFFVSQAILLRCFVCPCVGMAGIFNVAEAVQQQYKNILCLDKKHR